MMAPKKGTDGTKNGTENGAGATEYGTENGAGATEYGTENGAMTRCGEDLGILELDGM